MSPTDVSDLSLWTLIDSLQRSLEDRGLEPAAVDSAVVRRLRTLLSGRARNDQRRATALAPFALSPAFRGEG